MELAEKNKIITQIATGIVPFRYNGRFLYVYPPSTLLKQLSYLYYDEVLDSLKYEEWFSNEEARSFLINCKLLAPDVDKQLERLNQQEEELKVAAFNAWTNPKQLAFVKTNVATVNRMAVALLSAKHSYDHLTREGYAEICRLNYIMENSIKDEKGKEVKVAEDAILCDRAIHITNSASINSEKLREIARSEPWRTMWAASGGNNPFEASCIDLTDNQRNLISYSRMYDNVFKHPESPNEKIIEDDVVLDGWMIVQRRKIEEGADDGHGGASEVFVMANTEEERRKIDAMNSYQATKIKEQRQQALSKAGRLKEADLPDVKQELIEQVRKEFSNKIKG